MSKILDAISPGAIDSGSATFACADAHTISLELGGKQFPVDPRDFVTQNESGDAQTCVTSKIVSTDPPSTGSLFSWSLGDPFFRSCVLVHTISEHEANVKYVLSNLVAFYYGNLTHPSVDPPRIGFKSRVPQNASVALQAAVRQAVSSGGNFECESVVSYRTT